MTQNLHDVGDVLGFMVLHCCFPMPECMEGDFEKPGILDFLRDPCDRSLNPLLILDR